MIGLTLGRKGRLIIISYIVLSTVLSVSLFVKYPYAEGRGYASILGVQEYTIPQEAADFILRDIDNKEISLKSYRGKVIMLNFWATWCYPCRLEMPSMERLYQQFKDKGFVVLSVASGDSKDSVSVFVKEYNITFPALLDSDLKVTDNYKVWALPTSYFINANGHIIGKVYGSRDWGTKEATQYIASILQVSL